MKGQKGETIAVGKAEYERKKREEELNDREKEITRRELRATALETLAERGLPKQLADILDYTDADSTNTSIESVEKVFREAVEIAVNDRLKGDPPKGGSGATNMTDKVHDITGKTGDDKNKIKIICFMI